MKLSVPILLLILYAVPAYSSRCGDADSSPHCVLVVPIAIIGEENRQSFAEFAEDQGVPPHQTTTAFAASGIFHCGGTRSSAQVTGARNVITTTAHSVVSEDCKTVADLTKCYFHRPDEPGKTYPVDPTSLRTGSDVGGCWGDDAYYDWAVLKLMKDVPVTPYTVPEKDPVINPPVKIFLVSHLGQNAIKKPNVTICAILAMFYYEKYPISTNCDSGGGTSGSAQFLLPSTGLSLDPRALAMTAIHQGTFPGSIDGLEFNLVHQFNISVPVMGAFARRSEKRRDWSRWAAMKSPQQARRLNGS